MKVLPLLLFAVSYAGAEKLKPAPAMPQEIPAQVFAVPCQKVWPYAIRTIVKGGFRPITSDREGGIASFDWTRGTTLRWLSANNDIDAFAYRDHGVSGFFRLWKAFRVDSATLTLMPEGDGGCRAEFTASFSAYDNSSFRKGWWVLNSKGTLERQVLGSISEATSAISPDTPKPPQEALADRPPPAPASAAPPTPAPQKAEPPPAPKPERQPDTGVVRLPG